MFQCDRTDSLDAYFKTVQSEGSPLIALLGCGCSPATEPVAEISHYENIIHVRTQVQIKRLSAIGIVEGLGVNNFMVNQLL